MRIAPRLLLAGSGLAAAAGAVASGPLTTVTRAAAPQPVSRDDFLLRCGECHADGVAKGGFSLDAMGFNDGPAFDPLPLDRMLRTLADGRMPPAEAGVLLESERQCLCDHLRAVLAAAPAAGATVRPLRRLTPEELDYTWGDMLGIQTHVAREHLPPAPLALGFDTVAVMPMTASDVEQLLSAAQAVLRQALGDAPTEERLPGATFKAGNAQIYPEEDGGVLLATQGTLTGAVTCPAPGDYQLTLRVGQTKAGDENAKYTVDFAGQRVASAEVDGKAATWQVTVKEVGKKTLAVRFTNDYWNPTTKADRNFILQSAILSGPLPDAATQARRARWLPAAPPQSEEAKTAARLIESFAQDAWRGLIGPEAVARITKVFTAGRQHGDSFAQALISAYTAALCSPRCTCLLERANPRAAAPRVDDATLANRLAYFLWSGPPDAALRQITEKLDDPVVRRQQTERLLADSKAERFAERFSGQWLQTRALDEWTSAPAIFPGWSPAWRQRLKREVTLIFLDTLRSGAPVTALLERPTTYLDADLATHYGVPAPPGAGFQLAPAPPHHTAGVLTSAAVLMLTSNPDRTSPVRRGKWVMEVLLDTPPPPPPPITPALPDAHNEAGAPRSARERLALHVERPDCRACHLRMDPLGLALESFDAAGHFRATADGLPIDESGTWPGGARFEGAAGIRSLILAHPDRLERVVLEKLFTYALGRPPAPGERQALEQIRQRARGRQSTAPLKSLVIELAASELFQTHPTRGESP